MDKIAEHFQPERIILFGSYAYGQPDEWSDVDVLVVMQAWNEINQSIKIWNAVDPPFAVDLIVRTPETLQWRLEEGDWFLREVVGKGKVLYTRPGLRRIKRNWPTAEAPIGNGNGQLAGLEPMKKLTKEWVRKAEQDWEVIRRIRKAVPPLHDMVCYHGQQCAEKYLKALMQELCLVAPRTHDLLDLLNQLIPHDKTLRALRRSLENLNKYSVEIRYPLTNASVVQARAAYRHAGAVRKEIRKRLRI